MNMKKTYLLLGSLFMGLALASCGSKNGNTNTVETTTRNTAKTLLTTPILEDASYSGACEQQGMVTSVDYTCHAYALEELYGVDNIMVEKQMNVYTPYGYDEEKDYNVLLLLHGAGQNEDYWFAQDDFEASKDSTVTYGKIGNITQNVVDNLIYSGEIDPLIIVTATYYSSHDSDLNYGTTEYPGTIAATDGEEEKSVSWPTNFYKEVINDILPLIATNYSTYAASSSDADLKEARDHFAYAGLSLGSMTGFQSIWMHCLDYISYIGNYSAGPIAVSKLNTANTAKLDTFCTSLEAELANYSSNPVHFWYNGCGSYDGLGKAQKYVYDKLLADKPGFFTEGTDVATSNCWYNSNVEGGHEYWSWIVDYYNTLQLFF